MNKHEEIRQRLWNYRHENPVSYESLAKYIGIGYATLWLFMNGKTKIHARTMSKIMKYLEEPEAKEVV